MRAPRAREMFNGKSDEFTTFIKPPRCETQTLEGFPDAANSASGRRSGEAQRAQRQHGAQGRDRTTDTAIFSRMLYQLSYLGTSSPPGTWERGFIVRTACPVHHGSAVARAWRDLVKGRLGVPAQQNVRFGAFE